MYVTHAFKLNEDAEILIRSLTPSFGYGLYGETVYYRTYSRVKPDGSQERWSDTIIRVINGIMSIRKSHMLREGRDWLDDEWQRFAERMAISMFKMEWLPPGRGLWACGTQFTSEMGSAALNNCAAVSTGKSGVKQEVSLSRAMSWMMDMLMCGCGVGFDTSWDGMASAPNKIDSETFFIPDSREGWVESVRKLISAYTSGEKFPTFNYSMIRARGLPIRRFGGTASGPIPLHKLHRRIEVYLDTYVAFRENPSKETLIRMILRLIDTDFSHLSRSELLSMISNCRSSNVTRKYSPVRCVIDIGNSIGACVVAGNVRRSAEIVLGEANDQTFINLKNYELNPERSSIGWMSNNTVILRKKDDLSMLPELTKRIRSNGEPGFLNMMNVRYGRLRFVRGISGNEGTVIHPREAEDDKALLGNPCLEIPLESFELCNLAEIFPSKILRPDFEDGFLEVVEYATFYASTVSLLPTHHPESNEVIARNRRIGVSLSGLANLFPRIRLEEFVPLMRKGYDRVREVNDRLAREAGVPSSIRVTTVKPSGTLSQLAGVGSGMHFPLSQYMIRRMRIPEDSPLVPILKEAGVPVEKDTYSDNTLVFSFPIHNKNCRTISEISTREQFEILETLQREWSDNSVSVTITFNPEDQSEDLEEILTEFLPKVKSCSLLPSMGGGYKQMPCEKIDLNGYLSLISEIGEVDWSKYGGSDGIMPRNCSNDLCQSCS